MNKNCTLWNMPCQAWSRAAVLTSAFITRKYCFCGFLYHLGSPSPITRSRMLTTTGCKQPLTSLPQIHTQSASIYIPNLPHLLSPLNSTINSLSLLSAVINLTQSILELCILHTKPKDSVTFKRQEKVCHSTVPAGFWPYHVWISDLSQRRQNTRERQLFIQKWLTSLWLSLCNVPSIFYSFSTTGNRESQTN